VKHVESELKVNGANKYSRWNSRKVNKDGTCCDVSDLKVYENVRCMAKKQDISM